MVLDEITVEWVVADDSNTIERCYSNKQKPPHFVEVFVLKKKYMLELLYEKRRSKFYPS